MKQDISSMNTQTITIGLLWHSLSSDNLGVGALTESQIAICEAAARRAGVAVRYVIFGNDGGSSYAPDGIVVEQGPRVSIRQILHGRSEYLRELNRCDLVLDIGEGDSFTDIYGVSRCLFLLVSKLAVLFKKKPLILSPQTIGPFERTWVRWVAAAIMRRAERVFARDELSSAYLRKCGVVKNVQEVVDVAFRLPFMQPEATEDRLRTRVGLNVSGLLFSGGYTGSNQFGLTLDYPELVRALIKHWTSDPSVDLFLVAHVIPDNFPSEDDRVAIAQLLEEFPSANAAPVFRSPSEAKSFIASLDFLTGARMHACIAAFSSGVPVVPLAYSRKFNGLLATLDYPWLADGKALGTEQALERILAGYEKREELALALQLGNAKAAERLQEYESFLCSLFERVARKHVSVASSAPIATATLKV